jgi:hypothetical protein
MKYGFENGLFYLDLAACSRPHGNMKEEHNLRAKEIAESSSKILVSLSGGVDSQSMLHSFYHMGVPAEYAFLYMPGYNDNEYQQVQILQEKYSGIKLHIVDLDVMSVEDRVHDLAIDLDVPTKINIIQKLFLEQLPEDWDFVQMAHDPFVYVNHESGNIHYYQGYYLPEVTKQRVFESVNRSGREIYWCDSPEFLASIIDDEVYKAAIITARYFDGNGAKVEGKKLHTVDRWDYYIKPIIYGKYWQDELIYFPKFAGSENIPYIGGNPRFRKHALTIPYFEFLNFLNQNNGEQKRFYENVKYVRLNE